MSEPIVIKVSRMVGSSADKIEEFVNKLINDIPESASPAKFIGKDASGENIQVSYDTLYGLFKSATDLIYRSIADSYTKSEVDGLVASGIRDIQPASANDNVAGLKFPTQSGTYTNYGGIVVDLSEGLNMIFSDGDATFTKTVIPIDLSGYSTPLEVKEKVRDNNPVNLNDNYRWLRPLHVGTVDAPDYTYIGVAFGSDPYDVSPSLVASDFEYVGNKITVPFVRAGWFSIYIPNRDLISTGDDFKVYAEIKTSIDVLLDVSVRNNALGSVAGGQTISFVANTPKIIEFNCTAINNATFYTINIVKNGGALTFDLSIGRVFFGFGGDSLEGENQATLDYLRRRGFLQDLDLNGHALKNVKIGGDDDAIPKKEVQRLIDLPISKNLLRYTNQEIGIWDYAVPRPDSTAMLMQQFNQTTTVSFKHENTKDLLNNGELVFPDYVGNATVVDLSNSNNNWIFLLYFKISQLTRPIVGNTLYFSVEMSSKKTLPVYTLRGYKNSDTLIDKNASKYNNTTITVEPKVFQFELDVENVTESNNIGFRMITLTGTTTQDVEELYIGRISVSDEKFIPLTTYPSSMSPSLVGKSINEIGDSIVAQMRSLTFFVRKTGAFCNSNAIINGQNGGPALGVGGSRIIPYTDFSDSIYTRCENAGVYKSDIIVLYGGTNDPRPEFVANDLWVPGLILGDHSDPEFTGSTVGTFAEYLAYWQSIESGTARDNANPNDWTFASMYKGCIRRLLDGHPNGILATKTIFVADGGQGYQDNVWTPLWDLVRQIAADYGIICIDCDKDAGINLLNKEAHFNSPDYVHHNHTAGKRNADVMIRELSQIRQLK
jgi:hypothetical protein